MASVNKNVYQTLPKDVSVVVGQHASALFINTKEMGLLISAMADNLALDLTALERVELKRLGRQIDDRYAD